MRFNPSAFSGMESTELGLVQAEEAREVAETARSHRKFLPVVIWRFQGDLRDGKKSCI